MILGFWKAGKEHRTWRLPAILWFVIELQIVSEHDGELKSDLSCSLVAEDRASG
jgi:hypothetical protein